MKVELEIDEYWFERAKKVPGSMDLQAMVTMAFRQFVEQYEEKADRPVTSSAESKIDGLLALAGKIEFFEGFDPRAEFCGAMPPLTEEEKRNR